jgi:RNA polymerase sigma-70 factor, ECF subfamily
VSLNKKSEISEWYVEHSEAIFKFILMMTHDYQKSEDLTQETFLKAYKYHDTFQRTASEKTWLFRIAHNVTVDFIRRQKPLLFFKTIFLTADSLPSPQEVVEVNEEAKEIYDILRNLKASYREVIILRKIKEFSTKETASILGWSESKVKSTLSRALVVLEAELLKEGYGNDRKMG